MKTAIAAVLFATLVPAIALAQTAPPMLLNPADANRDGVVTPDEKADYLAKKAAGVRDQPPTLGVAAPKAGGNDTVVMGKPGAQPGAKPDEETGAAGPPPAAASEFEKSVEAGIRKDARDD